MSTKEQTWEPGVMLTCDAPGPVRCGMQVRRAPVLAVPSRTPLLPGHKPMVVMTTLHYCEIHRNAFDPVEYWTDANKKRLEDRARQTRPAGFKPDFDACQLRHVLVTTPEYRRFMAYLGVRNVAA